jgi:hypothetical protein
MSEANQQELGHHLGRGNEYELAQWAVIPRGNGPSSESMRGSQIAILGSEDGDRLEQWTEIPGRQFQV